jgi:predicted amidophosphoribosyltransferase
MYVVYCSKCGAKLPEDVYFCSHCGYRTKKGVEAGAHAPMDDLKEEFSRFGQEMEKAFEKAAKEIHEAFKTARENIKQSVKKEAITCPHCGKDSPSGSSFCVYCGKKFD